MTKRPKKPGLVDEIRAAVKASGMSQYDLSRESGVSESAVSRFVSGERGLSMEALDAIAGVLGLHVVARPIYKRR